MSDDSEKIEVKQAPTKATVQRTATIGFGGVVSTTGLTLLIGYLFYIYADAHPGFKTPVQAMGSEVGAAIYAFIAGCLTGIWQATVSWMVRGTLVLKGSDDDQGA